MRFFEYEAREIVRRAGIPVTDFGFTRDPVEAGVIAARIGGPVVVKSQVTTTGPPIRAAIPRLRRITRKPKMRHRNPRPPHDLTRLKLKEPHLSPPCQPVLRRPVATPAMVATGLRRTG